MKHARFSRSLILILPVLSGITSVGIVAQQSVRRDGLNQKLAMAKREIATLEKRYRELASASAHDAPADSPLQGRHAHEHHEGDGD